MGIQSSGNNRVKDDYAETAFLTEGAAWALDMRRKGGHGESSLTNALADYTVTEMLEIVEDTPVISQQQSSSNQEQIAACTKNIQLLNVEGVTTPPYQPIQIMEQNGDSVKFMVRNPFVNVERIYVQYEEPVTGLATWVSGDTKCYAEDNVMHEEAYEYTAFCLPDNPISVVQIWVSDNEALRPGQDQAKLHKCCPGQDDTNAKVQYTYMLFCNDACPTQQRKLGAPTKAQVKFV